MFTALTDQFNIIYSALLSVITLLILYLLCFFTPLVVFQLVTGEPCCTGALFFCRDMLLRIYSLCLPLANPAAVSPQSNGCMPGYTAATDMLPLHGCTLFSSTVATSPNKDVPMNEELVSPKLDIFLPSLLGRTFFSSTDATSPLKDVLTNEEVMLPDADCFMNNLPGHTLFSSNGVTSPAQDVLTNEEVVLPVDSVKGTVVSPRVCRRAVLHEAFASVDPRVWTWWMSKSVNVPTGPESVVLASVAIEDDYCPQSPDSLQKDGGDSCGESLPLGQTILVESSSDELDDASVMRSCIIGPFLHDLVREDVPGMKSNSSWYVPSLSVDSCWESETWCIGSVSESDTTMDVASGDLSDAALIDALAYGSGSSIRFGDAWFLKDDDSGNVSVIEGSGNAPLQWSASDLINSDPETLSGEVSACEEVEFACEEVEETFSFFGCGVFAAALNEAEDEDDGSVFGASKDDALVPAGVEAVNHADVRSSYVFSNAFYDADRTMHDDWYSGPVLELEVEEMDGGSLFVGSEPTPFDRVASTPAMRYTRASIFEDDDDDEDDD